MSLNEPILVTGTGGPRKTVVPTSVERVVVSLNVFDGGSVKDAGNAGKASVEVDKASKVFRVGDVRGFELGRAVKVSKLGEAEGKMVATVLCELSSSIGSGFLKTGLLGLVFSG